MFIKELVSIRFISDCSLKFIIILIQINSVIIQASYEKIYLEILLFFITLKTLIFLVVPIYENVGLSRIGSWDNFFELRGVVLHILDGRCESKEIFLLFHLNYTTSTLRKA